MSRAEISRGRAKAPLLRCFRATFVIGLAALALTSVGCASSPYRGTLDSWTRSDESYRQTEVLASADATLQTTAFRRAYVAEYARVFALTDDQREALLEAQLEEDRTGWTVIVAFYAADTAWNNLDPRHGIWEVRLEGPNGWLPPRRVRRLDPKNPTWRELYPFFGPHERLYELRFDRGVGGPGDPLARSGEELALVIAGAPARIRLSWPLP